MPNGLEVITAPDKSNSIISLQLYVKVGSVCETESTGGFAHFIEHLVFKNTVNYPDNLLSSAATDMGAVINAYTDFDVTCYSVMLPSENIETGLRLLSELAYNSVFTSDDVRIEKDVIIEEIKQCENECETSFIEWIQKSYFLTSPLKNPVLGTRNSILNSDYEGLMDFYRKYYKPSNAFLVVTGNCDEKHINSLVSSAFNSWKDSNIVPAERHTTVPEANGFRFFIKHQKKKIDSLAFVLPEPNETNEFSDALQIVTKAFASGSQSRLYKRLIEKDKAALDISLHSINGLLPGITIIQIVPVRADCIQDIIYAFYDEWIKVLQFSLLSSEINSVKRDILHSWLYDFEYIETYSANLANDLLLGDHQRLYHYPEKLAEVNAQAVSACIGKFWKLEYISIYYQGGSYIPHTIYWNVLKLFSTLANGNLCRQSLPELDSFDHGLFQIPHHTASGRNTPEFKQIALDCGMKLMMKRVVGKPTIGLAITSSVSQLSESQANYGINYLTSNLLLFGTQTKTFSMIQQKCLEYGFGLQVTNTLETTSLKGKCLSMHLDKMLGLASDIIQNPSFPPRYLKHIINTISKHIRSDFHDPFSHAYNKWVKMFMGKGTNLHKPFATLNSLNKIKMIDIAGWFQRYYSLPNFTICLAGDFDFENAETLCNGIFVKDEPVLERITHDERFDTTETKTLTRKVSSNQSNIIVGGWGCPGSDTKSGICFAILSIVLGEELSSRFYSVLREKYGLAYQAGFDFVSSRNLGYWYGYAICDKADYKETYMLMLQIISDVAENGISETELQRAKNLLKGYHRFDLESVSWQALSLSVLYTLGYDYNYFVSREDMIDEITATKVAETAKQWLNPNNIYSYIEN